MQLDRNEVVDRPKISSWKSSILSEDNSVFESISKNPLKGTKVWPRLFRGNVSLLLKSSKIISAFVKILESRSCLCNSPRRLPDLDDHNRRIGCGVHPPFSLIRVKTSGCQDFDIIGMRVSAWNRIVRNVVLCVFEKFYNHPTHRHDVASRV